MTGTARTAWRRGGRWDRILAALYRHDLAEPAIRHATQTGKHPRKLECKKVKRALAAMTRQSLVRRTGPLYAITALGSRTLIDGTPPPPAPRAPAPPAPPSHEDAPR